MEKNIRLSGYQVIRFLIILLILNCSLIIVNCSFAQDVPRFYGEEVVVTASRLPQLGDKSPWDTSLIDARELKNFKNVGEAMRIVTGTDVISYGSLGTVTSARIRGANSSQVLVLVDGRRVNSPTLGTFDLGDLLVDNIKQIEVVRAPLSAVYGSDAVSGVINLITKNPSAEGKAVSVSTGSFGTNQYKLSFSNNNYLFSADQLSSSGFRQNSDYLANNFYGKVNFQAPAGTLFADFGYYDANKGISGVPTSEADPYSASEPNDRQRDKNTIASIGIQNDNYLLRLYQNSQNQSLAPYSFGVSTNETLQTAVEWNQNFQYAGGRVLFGLEGREDHGKTTMSGDHLIQNYAAFAQDELMFGDKTMLTASLRGDKHSTAGASINPRLGLAYQAGDDLVLRASAGTAFRAPTLNELYWNDSTFLAFGNPNLKPEKSFSYEFGLDRQLTANTSAKLNYYNSQLTDLIQWNWDPLTGITQVVNIGTAHDEGVEFELSRRIGESGRGFINYTYQRSMNAQTNKFLPYAPENKYNIGLVLGEGSLIIKYVGERFADSANTIKLPSHAVIDLKMTRKLLKAELELGVQNLTDAQYSEIVGSYNVPGTFIYENRNYPMPGRSYSASLKWEL